MLKKEDIAPEQEYTIKDVVELLNVFDGTSARRKLVAYGIQPHTIKTTPTSRGQKCKVFKGSQLLLLLDQMEGEGDLSHLYGSDDQRDGGSSGIGWFYVVQLMPEFSERRLKLGFSSAIANRLRAFRTVAPTATCIRKYRCERVWELSAIASITRIGCSRVGEEVFDVESVADTIARADAFFALMPKVE